jgi:hypothetical protein
VARLFAGWILPYLSHISHDWHISCDDSAISNRRILMALKPNIVESIFKCLERRDWLRYQQYLSEREQLFDRQSKAKRLNYQEFRTQEQAKYSNNR